MHWARNLTKSGALLGAQAGAYENTTEKEKAKEVFSDLQKRKISFNRFKREEERTRAKVLREKRYFVIYLGTKEKPEPSSGFSYKQNKLYSPLYAILYLLVDKSRSGRMKMFVHLKKH